MLPWARAYEVARATPNTMIYSIAHTKVRDPLFQWVGSLKKENLYFWGLKSEFAESIDDIEQLKTEKIARLAFLTLPQYLQANNFKHIYELIKEDQNMVDALSRPSRNLYSSNRTHLKKQSKEVKLGF